MKKKAKKSPFKTKAHNKWIVDQVIKTINKELLPVKNTINDYQTSIQNSMSLLRDIQQQDVKKNKKVYKNLNLMLLIPPSKMLAGTNELVIEEQFRLLVKNVYPVKYEHDIKSHISQHDIDLILVMKTEEPLPSEFVTELIATQIKKAVWVSDQAGVTTSDIQLAPLFDYVFTQSPANVRVYQSAHYKHSYYLPFAVNTSLFYPKPVETGYQSDVLIIGDADPLILNLFTGSNILSDKKVRVCGQGWEKFDSTAISILAHEKLADYYNGTKIVINRSTSLPQILEVSACGTFQLIQQHSDECPHNWNDDFISYSTLEELTDKFDYYWSNIDLRRLAATRALAYNKYNHSFLQRGMQILDIVFN